MKSRRWLGTLLAALLAVSMARAQAPEIDLPRPGNIIAAEVTGEVTMITGDQRRQLKMDDRVRVGATLTTGRRSMVTLLLSNGATVQLGSESELELEEFGQAPVTGSVKFADLKAEPTLSRTRLRLARGDVLVNVKPLKVARGSLFTLTSLVGTVRLAEGVFRVMERMHDLGLGVSSVEVMSGPVEFEAAGTAKFVPVAAGRKLSFAIELDKSGAVKIGEMPKAPPLEPTKRK